MLKYALGIDSNIRQNENKNLVITCLDQICAKDYYMFDCGGETYKYQYQDDFVDSVLEKLDIDFKHVYVSNGQHAEDITLFK